MLTKTPRSDDGRFQSWETNVNEGHEQGRHQGQIEGALVLAAASLVVIGIKFAYLKIREKWF